MKSSKGCAHGLMQIQNPQKNFLDSKPILSIALADLVPAQPPVGPQTKYLSLTMLCCR